MSPGERLAFERCGDESGLRSRLVRVVLTPTARLRAPPPVTTACTPLADRNARESGLERRYAIGAELDVGGNAAPSRPTSEGPSSTSESLPSS